MAPSAAATDRDDGPGIPIEQQEEALDGGACLDSTSAGSGLGLAVKDIAEIWGAELSFETTAQGFTAGLAIPAVAAKSTVVPLAKRNG